MPRPWRSAAITALNTVLAGRPLVLTSRGDAYAEAVVAAGTPLDRAAVIELEPVTAAAVAAYLPAGQVDGGRRWARVVAELRDRPDGPLAQALSTPLMAYLARTVYAAPCADPADLADSARFPRRADLESHLLDEYLPAVYTASNVPPDPVPAGADHHRYDVERAGAWLAFLAARLPESDSGDLAWWNLPRCIARWRLIAGVAAGSVAGLAAGLSTGMATTLVFGSGWGLVSGLAAAAYMGVLCGVAYGSGLAAQVGRPRQVRLRLQALLVPTRAGTVRGTQCALIVGLEVGLFLGLAVGIRQGADAGIRQGITLAVLVGVPVGVVEFVAQNLTGLAFEPDEVSPRSSLVGDRTASLLHASVGVIVFGVPFGLLVGLLTGLPGGLAAGLAVGAGAALTGAIFTGFPAALMPGSGLRWVRFAIARTWLAARRQTPFRLLRFLDDAHTRGVLRQTGAVYQFRHAQLREHLALGHSQRHDTRHPAAPAPLDPTSPATPPTHEEAMPSPTPHEH